MADGRAGVVILDDDTVALIRQVHQRRIALKMTRRACSLKSGLTERAIYKIETLTVNPMIDSFMRYAAAVGLHLTLVNNAD